MPNTTLQKLSARLHFWFINARPSSLPQSMMTALTAAAVAAAQPGFSLLLAIIAVLGAALAHLSMNLFDDYFDYQKLQSTWREDLAASGQRARTGKCPYLTSGAASVDELLLAACGFGAAAVLCGLPILLCRGWVIMWPVVLCAILGIFYSAEPLRLSYRGLGEAVIGVIFGPLLMAGVYMAACSSPITHIIVPAIALGLLVTNILYTHSVLDAKADSFAGKRTLAGLLQTPERMQQAAAFFCFAPFGLMLLAVLSGLLTPWWLLTLLALPLAIALYRSVSLHIHQPHITPQRRLWYGPIANWQRACQNGQTWFVLRWYMARNLTALFALLCTIAALLCI